MRILIVSASALHGDHDPRTIRARRLIEELPRNGIEASLLGFWSGGGSPPPSAAGTLAITVERAFDDPGAFAEWARRGEAALAALPAGRRPQLIYAIGYPVEALIAGAQIAAATGIPWIADLGDPWPADDGPATEARAQTLASAAALVVPGEALAEQLRPLLRREVPVHLSPAGGVVGGRRGAAEPPLVVHLGSINPGRVDPRPAFETLAAAHGRGEIEFRSHTNGWHEEVDLLGHPHLPMLAADDAIDLLARSSAALVLGNRNTVQVPSKVYEIACTETWGLCVSELAEDPAAEVLHRSGHGIFARNDRASIRVALEELLRRERAGDRPHPAAGHSWRERVAAISSLIGLISSPNTETRG